jgi:hypothetical protein
MKDPLEEALADIVEIRNQIAASTAFRGFGPATLTITGLLPLLTATGQSLLLKHPDAEPLLFFAGWIGTAIVCIAIIGVEMLFRSRQHHSGLADAVIYNAIEQFLPAGAAGAFLVVVLARFAPSTLWLVPGLWQVLVSLGIFASVRSLPRAVILAGAWYFVAGFAVLMLASQNHGLSPWTMGIPFAVGQFLLAAIIHFSMRRAND